MSVKRDRAGRSLLLTGDITEGAFAQFTTALGELLEEPGPISLMVTCRGGELMAGFAMYDAILAAGAAGSPITGYVFGRAASMASVVFQACAVRLMTPNSWLHIHSMRWGAEPQGFEKHAEELRENDRLERQCYRLLARRSIYTPRELRVRAEGREYSLNAREAVREGFADAVVAFPEPRRRRA